MEAPESRAKEDRAADFLARNGDFHLRSYPRALRNADKWAHQKGTVGAVVMDASGDIAAGTSTGGLMGKMPGRVGDTPGVSQSGDGGGMGMEMLDASGILVILTRQQKSTYGTTT